MIFLGLSKARVKALLMFGKMEEVAAAHGELLPDLSADMEDLFGVEDRFDDKIRVPNPPYTLLLL